MQEAKEEFGTRWWQISSRRWFVFPKNQEEQVFLVLTLVIGALVDLTVVAFIVLTERFGARIYPPGGAAWHRLLAPIVGAYFGELRNSGKLDRRPGAWHYLGRWKAWGDPHFCDEVQNLEGHIPRGPENPREKLYGRW
jgi:hypothetical protein